MFLTRADLENDLLRATFRRVNPEVRVLTDAEQEASLREILDRHEPGADVWLFGYGSLVWNPLVHYQERRVARLHGFHRSFCLWSHVNRGSLQRPGLVLGLDAGGSCRGVAYRIAAQHAEDELRLLWRREMVLGAYRPRWAKVDSGGEPLQAIAFFVNREHANYAGKLPLETVIKTLVSTRGQLGTPAEYLIETVRGLIEHGVRDPYLLELRKRVLAMHPELAPTHAR
ncbi:MAG TPA: gamma-glutamylcyclotransferase [Burkholderiales bacterium]|nr:gamma-glutamylcyclotransferase [Burkholderiales bacterium]